MTEGQDLTADGLAAIARSGRALVLRSVAHAQAGHVGGPLSAMDLLVALYFRILSVRPRDPLWPDRDRFVLSKGHSAIALYAVLAMRGFLPLSELDTFDAIDSRLQGHPDMTRLPGIDMSSGSLGLGFSAAVGMALGARTARKEFTTFVMLGDGECNEGIVWEGAHVAGRYGLDNLVAIVDDNRLQQYGWASQCAGDRMPPYTGTELYDRWRAFGWHVVEIDGHDMEQILHALEGPRAHDGRPQVVIARTVKGKGVSFMENDYRWHARVPNEAELAAALSEVDAGEMPTEAVKR